MSFEEDAGRGWGKLICGGFDTAAMTGDQDTQLRHKYNSLDAGAPRPGPGENRTLVTPPPLPPSGAVTRHQAHTGVGGSEQTDGAQKYRQLQMFVVHQY